MRRVVVALLGVACMSVAANAADLPVKAPMAPVVAFYNWSGFYLGGEVGYQWNSDEFGDPNRVGGPVGPNTFKWNGVTGGALAGYNYQINALVLGVEGDFEWVGGGTGSGIGTVPPGATPWVVGHANLQWQASLRGRIGYAMDATLFYVTGGAAFGHFVLGFNFPIGAPDADNFSKTLTGWTIGAGVEHGFTPNWIARIEYRYTDYGHADGSVVNCCAPPPDLQHHELTANAIRAALIYRFGP